MKDKKYNYALVVGKFDPIHIGHEKLINKALEVSIKTLVLVTNSAKEKISISKRIKLISNIYEKDILQNKLCVEEFINPSTFNLNYGDMLFDKYYNIFNSYPEVIIYGNDKDITFCFRKELISKIDSIIIKRDGNSSTKVRQLLKSNDNIKIKNMINEKIIEDIDKSIFS